MMPTVLRQLSGASPSSNEREALLKAFRANDTMLRELQAANAELMGELEQIKKLRMRRPAA